jgi:hypothetical protein
VFDARIRLAVTAILSLALAGPAVGQEKRPFDMGFTPFPYDLTAEAVADTYKFVRENGDLLCLHFDNGVPWTEAAAGKPFSKHLQGEWKGKVAAKPKGGKVYVALSPGRNDLANYWGEKDNLPLPAAFKGKAFNDPAVKAAYLAYVREAIKVLKPDYLAIGIEVNEVRMNGGREKWKAYLELHKHVYAAVKKDNPKLPVFASFTLHNLMTKDEAKRSGQIAALDELMPYCDLVGASFYPFMAGGTTDIAGAFKFLTESFDQYGKPYCFAETAELAEKLTVPKTTFTIPGTAERQRAYVEQLLAFAGEKKAAFVVWFLPRDYDALWEKIKRTAPPEFGVWRDCGLLNEAGGIRPALDVWQEHFKKPR